MHTIILFRFEPSLNMLWVYIAAGMAGGQYCELEPHVLVGANSCSSYGQVHEHHREAVQ